MELDFQHDRGVYFVLQNVQTGSGAHPAFYSMGTGHFFSSGVTRSGREADHLPSGAKIKNEQKFTSTPRVPSKRAQGQRHRTRIPRAVVFNLGYAYPRGYAKTS
jgi:hypothetical protein